MIRWRRSPPAIAEFGFTNPILAGSDGIIVAGHGRLGRRAEARAGTVPVVVLDHLSPTQRRALVIADNRIAENAGWDDAMLRIELEALQDEGFDWTSPASMPTRWPN
jgi:ParB-like chromosome segregation protein Spo0J